MSLRRPPQRRPVVCSLQRYRHRVSKLPADRNWTWGVRSIPFAESTHFLMNDCYSEQSGRIVRLHFSVRRAALLGAWPLALPSLHCVSLSCNCGRVTPVVTTALTDALHCEAACVLQQ